MLQGDYRNAQRIIQKSVDMAPNNPYILSKAGRTQLEIGRKLDALKHFNKVKAIYKNIT
jgi:tetratricopeptide (TPR) repeat protein